jgi:Glycosyltransferase family 20
MADPALPRRSRRFSRRDLSGYLRVNDHFAQELHEVLGPDDLVWVHDYHLIPLAKALRERGHGNRIDFFLHIPCPPPEILTALPNHERLIPTLCEYDLVGFQTGDDAFNFSRYLTRECGLHSYDFNCVLADRTIGIEVFPVGIETAAFAYLSQRSVRLPFVKRVIKSLNGRALIIGVDRLTLLHVFALFPVRRDLFYDCQVRLRIAVLQEFLHADRREGCHYGGIGTLSRKSIGCGARHPRKPDNNGRDRTGGCALQQTAQRFSLKD